MSVFFISDLHLSPERPAVTRAFFTFLTETAHGAEALYILGDLFEAWIGDDDPSELSLKVKEALKALSSKGTPLFIQQGNRDFLLGKRFMRETGGQLLSDQHLIEYHGEKALVMHGDMLCTDDAEYQKFRRKARNPVFKWCLAHLPLRRRQAIAADWRAKSMTANSNKPSAIMDVNLTEVARVMSENQVKTLIHGHTHRPARHSLMLGERIVLGDWHDKGWYLKLNEDGYSLENFPIDPI